MLEENSIISKAYLEDSSLNSSTVGNSLIGIDGFVELLSVEEILQQLLHLRNTG